MKPSQECLIFAMSEEDCRLKIYPDLNGFPTVGWGHKLTTDDVTSGRYAGGISQAEADALFTSDAQPVTDQVNGLGMILTQGQFDCLWDFTFNEGISRTHTMLDHGIDQVPVQLPRWKYAGGVVQPGLVTRRAQELAWWMAGE